MTVLERQKEIEEWVVQNLQPKDRATQLIAYKFLRGLGITSEGIDAEIYRLLKQAVRLPSDTC